MHSQYLARSLRRGVSPPTMPSCDRREQRPQVRCWFERLSANETADPASVFASCGYAPNTIDGRSPRNRRTTATRPPRSSVGAAPRDRLKAARGSRVSAASLPRDRLAAAAWAQDGALLPRPLRAAAGLLGVLGGRCQRAGRGSPHSREEWQTRQRPVDAPLGLGSPRRRNREASECPGAVGQGRGLWLVNDGVWCRRVSDDFRAGGSAPAGAY